MDTKEFKNRYTEAILDEMERAWKSGYSYVPEYERDIGPGHDPKFDRDWYRHNARRIVDNITKTLVEDLVFKE